MMMMYSTHGLFLTCTQISRLYLHMHNQMIFTQCTQCTQLLIEPLAEITKSPTYLEGQFLAHGGESPSTLVPCLLPTALIFTPLPTPQPHYTIYDDVINNHGLLRLGQFPPNFS
jgi:hypothetical protein